MIRLWHSKGSRHYATNRASETVIHANQMSNIPKPIFHLACLVVVSASECDHNWMLQNRAEAFQKNNSCLSFIHIPKTGGGSVEAARVLATGTIPMSVFHHWFNCSRGVRQIRAQAPAQQFGRIWGLCDDQLTCHADADPVKNSTCYVPRSFAFAGHQDHQGRIEAFHPGNCSKWHVPPGLDSTLAASYQSCDTFCIVRDPVERLLSEYNFVRPDVLPCGDAYLEEFVRSRLKTLSIVDDCHFIPQVYYVFENGDHRNGRRLCHHILQRTKLSDQFPKLMKQYGLNDVQLPSHPNHQGRECSAKLSPSLLDLVKEFYRADYEAFGF
eukprot:Skav213888  [mRNA]  locus=scaffold245:96549:97526:- [translate_table: standard]